MKLAVDRNRMRRLLREAYRLNKHRYQDRLKQRGKQCAWLFIYQGKAAVDASRDPVENNPHVGPLVE
jgi:RNase P protein component